MPLVDDPMDESTAWLVEDLQRRFPGGAAGLLRDTESGDTPVWCVSLAQFDHWFTELESTLDLTLGRRLAHAAAESEEQRWTLAPPLPKAWFGERRKRLATVNADWALRGLGQLAWLEDGEKGEMLLVANRPQTALAAGMANAAWECITGRRSRFQWSDRGVGETVVELTPDPRSIPAPQPTSAPWIDATGQGEAPAPLFERARDEGAGLWTVEGQRALTVQRDLLLRFESLVMPHLLDSTRDADRRTEWSGIEDDQRLLFWDGAAEAARRQFLAAGELVLIADADHWVSATRRHLGAQGLGAVVAARSVDDHGGVELELAATLHPALSVGRLLGCWERAEGRGARATWRSHANGHTVRLESRRTIAE